MSDPLRPGAANHMCVSRMIFEGTKLLQNKLLEIKVLLFIIFYETFEQTRRITL